MSILPIDSISHATGGSISLRILCKNPLNHNLIAETVTEIKAVKIEVSTDHRSCDSKRLLKTFVRVEEEVEVLNAVFLSEGYGNKHVLHSILPIAVVLCCAEAGLVPTKQEEQQV